MKLREISLNENFSKPYKRIHLDLTCIETIEKTPSFSDWKVQDADNFANLRQKEEDFVINPLHLAQVQTQITSSMRSTLLNWLMETSNDLLLKRETFHMSILIIDRFLSLAKMAKKSFQLLGISALFISSKSEEISVPRISDFAASTGDYCSPSEIIEMERKIMNTLRWKVLSSTLYAWSNWLMSEWDSFNSDVPIKLKQSSKNAYRLLRQVFGILDAVALDDFHLRFRRSALAAGTIYLVLQRESCTQEFSNHFASAFEFWLQSTLNFEKIESLAPAIEYLQQFLALTISYELPRAKDVISKESLIAHFEDFLAFQTYTAETLPFVKAKILARCKA
jgi:hypothetical protein